MPLEKNLLIIHSFQYIVIFGRPFFLIFKYDRESWPISSKFSDSGRGSGSSRSNNFLLTV